MPLLICHELKVKVPLAHVVVCPAGTLPPKMTVRPVSQVPVKGTVTDVLLKPVLFAGDVMATLGAVLSRTTVNVVEAVFSAASCSLMVRVLLPSDPVNVMPWLKAPATHVVLTGEPEIPALVTVTVRPV